MKKIFLTLLIAFTVSLLVSPLSANVRKGNVENLPNVPVDPARIVTFAGTVNAVMIQIPVQTGNAAPVPHALIKVKIREKETGVEHIVILAPGNFLAKKGLTVNNGDQVAVKAFRTEGITDLKSMTIEKSGRLLVIRNEFGRGIWEKSDIRPGRDNRIK